MIAQATTPRRVVAAIVLAALLAVTLPAPAQSDQPVDKGTSSFQWVIRASFLVSLIVIGAVLVRAFLSGNDDTSRLRAAAGKVDRALADEQTRSWAGWPGNNTRFDGALQRPGRDASPRRLLPALALRPVGR